MASFGSILVISCMLILTYHASTGEGFMDHFFGVRRLKITNDLCNTTKLTIHCGSGDDDFGEQVLDYQSSFGWKFKLNWFRLTLFWCHMSWENHRALFDVYQTERDEQRCQRKCWWSIQKDGAYMFDQRNDSYGLMYKWPN